MACILGELQVCRYSICALTEICRLVDPTGLTEGMHNKSVLATSVRMIIREIDVLEGVHDQEHNQVTWHTGAGCNLTPNANFTGTVVVSWFCFNHRTLIHWLVRELSTVTAQLAVILGAGSLSGAVHLMVPSLTPREVVFTP